MNICIVTSSFPLNRNEIYHRFLEEIIRLLHANGHRITILTQDKRGEKEIFFPDVEVIWFPWKMSATEVLANISLKNVSNFFSVLSLVYNGVKHARRVGAEKKIDLFICLWVIPAGLYVFLKNFISAKTPYLVWALGSDIYALHNNFLGRFFLRRIIKNSKEVFADGFELCEIINKISGRECHFLPTVHTMHNNVSMSSAAGSPDKEVSFLCVGNLTYVKGFDVLVQACVRLRDQSGKLNFKCKMIGSGIMMEELASEIKRNNLEDHIELLGRIADNERVAEYFSKADCVIIPSRSDSIPVVLSEAIQLGKAVIVTDAGDMEYIVKKYNLGLVARKNDPGDLAEKIKSFITSPVQLKEQDRKEVLELLLLEKNNAKFLQAISVH